MPHEIDFCALPPEARKEIRGLAEEFGWSISEAAERYLLTASAMATASRVAQLSRAPTALSLIRPNRA
jgi:hypothetical protein